MMTSQQKSLRSVARRVYRFVHSLQTPDTISQQIGEIEAEFVVQTPIEFNRLTGRLQAVNEPIILNMLESIKEDDTVWDVGGHIGRYSCFLGQKIESGTLVVFEPFPKNISQLRKNLERNGINAMVEPYALAEDRGTISRPLTHDEAGVFVSSAENSQSIENTDATIEFETKTGDGVVSEDNLPTPDVVRIDTSGGEPQVLRGMQEILSKQTCRRVYAVAYRHRYNEEKVLESLLEPHNFEVELLETPAELDIILASK